MSLYTTLNDKEYIEKPLRDIRTNEIQNGAKMQILASHGCLQQEINHNSFMINEEECTYISGKHIVKMDIKSKQQQFYLNDKDDSETTAFQYTFEKKNKEKFHMFAIALKPPNDDFPYVKILRQQGKDPIKIKHEYLAKNSSIIDLIFLKKYSKTKYLLTLGTNYSNISVISLLSINKSKPIQILELDNKYLGFVQIKLSYDCFIIWNQNMILEYNYTIQKGNMKGKKYPIHFFQQNEYCVGMSQQFQTNNLGIITNQNNFYLNMPPFGKNYLKIQLNNLHKLDNTKANQKKNSYYLVSAICPIPSGGFCLGFCGINCLVIIDVKNDQLYIKSHHIINQSNIYKIVNMHCSPQESQVVITILHSIRSIQQQIEETIKYKRLVKNEEEQEQDHIDYDFTKNIFEQIPGSILGRIEIYLFNIEMQDLFNQINKQCFEPLFQTQPFKGPIIDLSVCVSQAKFLVLGDDKNMRMFSFVSGKGEFQCIMNYSFGEMPLSIAIQQHSFQIAAGFKDGLKLFVPIEDYLELIMTYSIKACTCLQYNQTGSILAAGAGNNQIHLYNSYTLDLIGILTGHIGIIKSL